MHGILNFLAFPSTIAVDFQIFEPPVDRQPGGHDPLFQFLGIEFMHRSFIHLDPSFILTGVVNIEQKLVSNPGKLALDPLVRLGPNVSSFSFISPAGGRPNSRPFFSVDKSNVV
jgi:hypothetical protein